MNFPRLHQIVCAILFSCLFIHVPNVQAANNGKSFHSQTRLRAQKKTNAQSREVHSSSQPTTPTVSLKPEPVKIWKRMDLDGSIDETDQAVSLFGSPNMSLRDFHNDLDQFSNDKRVAGILIHIQDPDAGFARVEELRGIIQAFRAKGKQAVAVLDDATPTGYLIATACDRIIIAPPGTLMLTGIHVEGMFFKDLFDRLGIDAEYLQMGKYKSAGETFTRTGWSQPAQEEMNALADQFYAQMVEMIAQGRKLTPDQVRQLINAGPFTAAEAVQRGLVDELAYEADYTDEMRAKSNGGTWIEEVKSTQSQEDSEPFNLFSFFSNSAPKKVSSSNDKIAVIFASGPIMPAQPDDSLFPEEMITPTDINQTLEKCLKDTTIKAVVLRIDSPGGDATSSDLIWREIRHVAQNKPVVASMGDTAASGGYYIAMGASRIIAQPGTLTGSIGVFGGKFVITNLLQKIGITTESVSRGKNSGLESDTAPYSDSERSALQRLLVQVYADFTSKAAVSRGMTAMEIEDVAQGRVWTGRQALDAHLVDELGGLDDAVRAAKKLAGLSPDQKMEMKTYPEEKGLREVLQKLLGGDENSAMPAMGNPLVQSINSPLIRSLLPGPLRENLAVFPLLQSTRPLALMPFVVRVY